MEACLSCRNLNFVLLIIDEISFGTPNLLAATDRRMRQIRDNDQPFGGIAVIITGDFHQLPPVRATSFFSSLMAGNHLPAYVVSSGRRGSRTQAEVRSVQYNHDG